MSEATIPEEPPEPTQVFEKYDEVVEVAADHDVDPPDYEPAWRRAGAGAGTAGWDLDAGGRP